MVLDRFKKWYKKQDEFSKSIAVNSKNKKEEKLEKNIELMLNSTGFKKTTAKANVIGINAFTKTYPAFEVDYVGGYYGSPEGKEDIKVILLPQGLMFSHLVEDDIIPYEDIKTVSFRTKEEIQRDITLTRFLAFGMWAFAMKKNKKLVNRYCVLNCSKNEMPYAVVFANEDVSNLYSTLFKFLSK